MIYAYDQNIQMPVKDLYDTQMMAIAINAAKDMYDNARLEIKDFNKLYGDFITPIAADQDWYDRNVTGKFLKEIDDMYARGEDPLRSAEGRSRIARLINSLPVSKINAMRANAANYEKFLAAKAELESQGMYDPELDALTAQAYGLPTEKDFRTIGPGDTINMWNRLSPTKYSTLNDLVTPLVKDLKPGELTKAEVEAAGMEYDPRRRYTGISEQMVRNTLTDVMPGVYGDPRYQYYRNRAEQKLRAQNPGKPITDADIDRQFMDDAFNAVSRFVTRPTSDTDKFAEMQFQYDLQDRNNARQHWRTVNTPKPGNGGGDGTKNPQGTYDYINSSWTAILTHGLLQNERISPNTLTNRQIAAMRHAKSIGKNGRMNYMDIINLLAVSDDSASEYENYLGRTPIDRTDGSFRYIKSQDARNLKTAGQLVANMQGFSISQNDASSANKYTRNLISKLNENAENNKDAYFVKTGRTVGITTKSGINKHYTELMVYNGDRTPELVYLDDEADLDALYRPTGNWARAAAGSQRASLSVANKNNKTDNIGTIH